MSEQELAVIQTQDVMRPSTEEREDSFATDEEMKDDSSASTVQRPRYPAYEKQVQLIKF
jgi:hypothetical protein